MSGGLRVLSRKLYITITYTILGTAFIFGIDKIIIYEISSGLRVLRRETICQVESLQLPPSSLSWIEMLAKSRWIVI